MEPILVLSSILLWMLVLLNLLLTLGLARRMRAVFPPMESLKVGQPAPDFTAQTLNGETVTLATYAWRPVAFVFVSPDCKPCREELPRLEGLRPKAEQSGVELVLVSDADEDRTQLLADEAKVTLPILVAPRGSNSFFRDYRVNGTPSYCLIDARGKVRSAGMGLFELEQAGEALSQKTRR